MLSIGGEGVTDRRQTTDGGTTTYSEHELEFTFAKNDVYENREKNEIKQLLLITVSPTVTAPKYALHY